MTIIYDIKQLNKMCLLLGISFYAKNHPKNTISMPIFFKDTVLVVYSVWVRQIQV